MAVLEANGVKPAEAAPKCPPELYYVFNLWVEIGAARQTGMASPNPISWSDIDAFCRVTGERLLPWEARVIRAIDDVYLASGDK